MGNGECKIEKWEIKMEKSKMEKKSQLDCTFRATNIIMVMTSLVTAHVFFRCH